MQSIKCLFLVALKQEIPVSLNKYMPIYSFKQLRSDNKVVFDSNMICVITGVGKKSLLDVINYIDLHLDPMMIVNFGTAGSNKYNIGDFIIPHSFHYKDQVIKSLFPVCPFSTPENLFYTDQLTTVETVHLNQSFDLVDMEAFFIAEYAVKKLIPFYCIKCVSDSNNITEFNKYLEFIKYRFNTFFNSQFNINPHVTVIIPTYNRHQTIERAIDSVLNQSIKVEIIVVDDASNDITPDLLYNYRNHIEIVVQDRNKGVSAARNAGAKLSKGNFISFLDSDDEWLPKKIEHQLNYFNRHPYYNIVQCDEKWIRHGKHFNKKKHHLKQEGFIFDDCLKRCSIAPSGVMIKKDFFNQFKGFNESFTVCEDYDLWLKMSRFYLIGLNQDIDLIKYGGHSDQLSSLPALDQYRIKSLEYMLKNEFNNIFKLKIESILNFKKSIYINGLKKRNLQ